MPPPHSPPNLPPNSPPNFPPGQFANGPRHAFAANYPYDYGYMGYSGWGAAAGHWSTPQEDAFGYGLAANERSFGEGPDGDVAGRYGFCHPPDDRHYFQQQRETTGKKQVMVLPQLGPKPSSRSYTATDTTPLRIRGLPSSSSSTNTRKTARLLPRLPRQLSLLRLPAQLQRTALPCSSSSHVACK